MRHILTFLALAASLYTNAQIASAYATGPTFTMLGEEIVVVQINAEWNDRNTRTDLERLRGCEYRFGYLEDQPEALKNSISAVPVVVIYKGNRPSFQFVADLSFSLDTPFEEIQKTVYMLKQ